ncbi:MAG TPA: hypothetical protein DHV28_01045 [Ignavibacteriales bacterium]|nr:hypothetical protein [Ignavibacteriales bacterium]
MLKNILTIRTIVILFGLIGSFSIILTTINFGLGLSPDSIAYLATSNNLLIGKGFISFDAQPLVEWPPLYSTLIYSFSYTFSISTPVSALLLNVLLFGMTIYHFGMILAKSLFPKSLIIVGLLFVIFSIPVFGVSIWMWSEILFITITLLFFRSLDSYLEKANLIRLIMLVIITSLAILTRYIGIVILLTTIISIFIFNSNRIKKKIILIFTYSVLSLLPVLLWLIRNYLISGTLFGRRGSTKNSFFPNLYVSIEKIFEWFVPDVLVSIKLFGFIILIITVSYLVFILLKKIKYKILLPNINNRKLVIISLFISIYLITIVILSSLKSFDPIGSRLLSPLYLPVTLLLLLITRSIYNHINKMRYKVLLFTLLMLSLSYPAFTTFQTAVAHYNYGSGYSGNSWPKNEKELWLNEIKKSYISAPVVYSNDPFAVYYLVNIYAKWSPIKGFGDSDEIYVQLNDLNGVWPAEKESYLIWFKHTEFQQRSLYKPNEIRLISNLSIMDSSEIGTLYSVIIKDK